MKTERFYSWARRLAATTAFTAGLNHPWVQANPVGGTVTQGGASFLSQGPQLTIRTTDFAAIHWQSFNIGAGQTTTFVQPTSSSVVWNYINGGSASQSLGSLNANGYVVLQNPSGFFIGGQAAISTHGLTLTTSATPAPNLASGGAWQFNAAPPAASIINYGQINVGPGGSAFLIAREIENHGIISAPGGTIGLYAGQEVLVSERPDGRGLSAKVKLPAGSVDNQGRLVADGGTIAMQAQVVNQGGLVQANSLREVNGVIELFASDAINLGANSVLSAKGDVRGASPGGAITIKSDRQFSDQAGSSINLAGGKQGGDGGRLEISAAVLGPIQSTVDGHATAGFLGGKLTLDPTDLKLDSAYVSSLAPVLNAGLYEIDVQADHNLELSTYWILNDPGASAKLTLTAGNDIILDNNSGIRAANHWGVSLTAGPQGLTSRPAAGTDSIFLNGNAYIQTQNGDINLWAANDVIVNPGPNYTIGSGVAGNNGIRTVKGGNIGVTALFGDVNAGGNYNGYLFGQANAPYYKVSANVGGISTAGGGNVTLTAGGNVASYLPVQSDYDHGQFDGGTGAFGPQPGDVTINAGGNVSGHYVLANGTGTITAGGDVGSPTTGGGFALSLIKGGWSVSAPNGNIYLQDARNPNGVFNDNQDASSYGGYHWFDYDPLASVSLSAGNTVEITGAGAPHYAPSAGQSVPMLVPPTLKVSAGAGGFVLGTDVILFPSASGDLTITTTHGGGFLSYQDPSTPYNTAIYQLAMSDSAATQWDPNSLTTFGTFLVNDHAATPPELNNLNPVALSISGNLENVNLRTTKATHIDVTGNTHNFGFEGENLHTTDKTYVNVTGSISYPGVYAFAPLSVGIAGAFPAQSAAWDAIFSFLVDPSVSLQVPSFVLGYTPAQQTAYAYNNLRLSLSGAVLQPGYNVNANPGFIYDSVSKQLGYQYQMNQKVYGALDLAAIPVLNLNSAGNIVIEKHADGNYYFGTTTAAFVPTTVMDSLYSQSLTSVRSAQDSSVGFQIGGPGQFKVSAASIDLGSSGGIMSWGLSAGRSPIDFSGLAPWTPSGAAVEVDTTGNLGLLTSTIASVFGGNVSVNCGGSVELSQGSFSLIPPGFSVCYGIFTSGHSDVSLVAKNDINIGGARVAAFNGGNVFVESLEKSVNAGSGGNSLLVVPVVYKDPVSGALTSGDIDAPKPFGSGVLALTPSKEYQAVGGSGLPGNITITTPRGDIVSSIGGIQQYALNGDVAGGPTITLTAGTKASGGSPAIPGNVDLGSGGVIGGTINITAQGNVKGLIISRQDANISAAQSFSGTLLSGGQANVSATAGSVSGTVIGIGGVSASGGQGVTAGVYSQNVSIGGGASQSTLGSKAEGTATSASAAGAANSDTRQQLANDTTPTPTAEDDLKKNKGKRPVLTKHSRVTVVLPPKS